MSSGSVVYRQGTLVVMREAKGWSVRDEFEQALVADDGAVACDAAVATGGGSVEVVATALSARVRGEGFHLHAGAVVVPGGLALVAGDSGAGKTTTCLALQAWGQVKTDDVCFLQRVGDDVVARPWRRPLHVGEVTQAMFPSLRLLEAPLTRAGKRQALLGRSSAALKDGADDVDGAASDATSELDGPLTVRALVFPSIDRTPYSRTRSATLTPTQALERLMVASAMVLWPGVPHAHAHLEVLGRLTLRPAFALTLGHDAQKDPSVIGQSLATAGLALAYVDGASP
jgi:hypothetical protein